MLHLRESVIGFNDPGGSAPMLLKPVTDKNSFLSIIWIYQVDYVRSKRVGHNKNFTIRIINCSAMLRNNLPMKHQQMDIYYKTIVKRNQQMEDNRINQEGFKNKEAVPPLCLPH